jgi:hypothetical protein
MKTRFGRDRKLQILELLFINAIPLIGVFYLGWKVGNIIFIYWLESIFIGIFNLLKMIFAQGKDKDNGFSKIGACLFFTVHYFIFVLAQGLFIGAFLITKQNFIFNFSPKLLLASLFIGYAIGFLQEYVLSGKYKERTPMTFFFAPYSRVFVQQILLIGTVFILQKYHFDQDLLMLIMFVGLKIIIDFGTILIRYLNEKQLLLAAQTEKPA